MREHCFFSTMGVLNATPDSFSDGGVNFQQESFKASLEQFLNNRFNILDIGAESSAPMNKAISEQLEKERLENIVFPVLKRCLPKLKKKKVTLSIDTYKPTIATYFFHFLKEQDFDGSIIWNDVSGIIDDHVFKWLELAKGNEYVYCSNHIPARDKTLNHLEFTKPKHDILEDIHEDFEKALKEIKDYKERLWLDPSFGFSKTREQNLKLLRNYSSQINRSSHDKHLIGVSRKSFFRKEVLENENFSKEQPVNLMTEYYQLTFLQKMISEASPNHRLIFRVHEPFILDVLDFYKSYE